MSKKPIIYGNSSKSKPAVTVSAQTKFIAVH